jgi:hypothetical protein
MRRKRKLYNNNKVFRRNLTGDFDMKVFSEVRHIHSYEFMLEMKGLLGETSS